MTFSAEERKVLAREPVGATKRKAMGRERKRRIHIARRGLCAFCKNPCERFGPGTIYDHIIPLALGGQGVNSNVQLLYAEPCNRLKTLRDRKHIAKAKRLAGETCAGPTKRPLKGRPFSKKLTRGFDGRVRQRVSR